MVKRSATTPCVPCWMLQFKFDILHEDRQANLIKSSYKKSLQSSNLINTVRNLHGQWVSGGLRLSLRKVQRCTCWQPCCSSQTWAQTRKSPESPNSWRESGWQDSASPRAASWLSSTCRRPSSPRLWSTASSRPTGLSWSSTCGSRFPRLFLGSGYKEKEEKEEITEWRYFAAWNEVLTTAPHTKFKTLLWPWKKK